jgi:hypothetical protein
LTLGREDVSGAALTAYVARSLRLATASAQSSWEHWRDVR